MTDTSKDFPLTLKGPRIELRTLEATFENARMGYDAVVANRTHLLPWMPWASEEITKSPESSFEYLIGIAKGRREKTKYDFGIFCDGKHIGNMGIFDISEKKKSAEIGYWLAKTATGKGYMSEAVKLIEDEAFRTLGLNRIQIKCDPRNTKSANVAKRLGYVLDGVIRNASFSEIEKIFTDDCVFSKLRSEWERQNK